MAVIFKRSPSELSERRIDPWHYQPEFERQLSKVESSLGVLPLEALIDGEKGVAGGATPLGANYLESGRVRFYRTSEVTEMFLDNVDAVYITDEDDQKLARSRLEAGNVLLTITGAKFGKSAVVKESDLPGNISQHSVRFMPDLSVLDPYFLVAYLNSPTGQIAIWREAYGATRPAIDFPSVRALAIPNLGLVAQKYIGDKVRQAEQLKAWAKDLARNIEELLAKFNPEHVSSGNKSNVNPNSLWETLNPNSYMPRFIDAENLVREHTHASISELSSLVSDGPFGSNLKVTDYVNNCVDSHPVLRVKNCVDGELVFDDLVFINKDKHQELIRSEVLPGDLLVTKAGRIGSSAVYPEGLNPGNITSHLIRARITDERVTPHYVAAFLETKVGRLITEQHSFKSTRPELTKAEIEHCIVPILDKNTVLEIDRLLKMKILTNRLAKDLLSASMKIVESLIMENCTEVTIIETQRALEMDDDQLERELLSQITDTGFNDNGKPLFKDLDQLYDILAQSKEYMERKA